ncbi:hypothetical protein D3C71_24580 [compost metagenome]
MRKTVRKFLTALGALYAALLSTAVFSGDIGTLPSLPPRVTVEYATIPLRVEVCSTKAPLDCATYRAVVSPSPVPTVFRQQTVLPYWTGSTGPTTADALVPSNMQQPSAKRKTSYDTMPSGYEIMVKAGGNVDGKAELLYDISDSTASQPISYVMADLTVGPVYSRDVRTHKGVMLLAPGATHKVQSENYSFTFTSLGAEATMQ